MRQKIAWLVRSLRLSTRNLSIYLSYLILEVPLRSAIHERVVLALVFSVGYYHPFLWSTFTSTVHNADLCLLAFYLDLPVGF